MLVLPELVRFWISLKLFEGVIQVDDVDRPLARGLEGQQRVGVGLVLGVGGQSGEGQPQGVTVLHDKIEVD